MSIGEYLLVNVC